MLQTFEMPLVAGQAEFSPLSERAPLWSVGEFQQQWETNKLYNNAAATAGVDYAAVSPLLQLHGLLSLPQHQLSFISGI